MAERKLDLNQLLDHITRKDADYFTSLPEEVRKEFAPKVIMRWLTCPTSFGKLDASGESMQQVYFVNALVNPFVFSLYKHPELLYKLMTLCTSGKSRQSHSKDGRLFSNYTYIKTGTTISRPLATRVVMDFLKYSSKDAVEALKILKEDDVIDMAEQLGWQKDDMTKLVKEYKK